MLVQEYPTLPDLIKGSWMDQAQERKRNFILVNANEEQLYKNY